MHFLRLDHFPVERHGVGLAPHDLFGDEAAGAAEGQQDSHRGDELPHLVLPRLQDEGLVLDAHDPEIGSMGFLKSIFLGWIFILNLQCF